MVLAMPDSSQKDRGYGKPFTLDAAPTTIKARIHWTSVGTTGNVYLGFAYRAIAAGEDMDATGQQEDVASTDAPPGTGDQLQTLELTLTPGNFAADDLVEWEVYRDSSNVGDTHASKITIHLVEIETT
jgi:hypothetical protein